MIIKTRRIIEMDRVSRLIHKADLVQYVQIKGLEDYAYTDMLTTLRNNTYQNMPDTFLYYMGRAIEDTITRIYPKSNTYGYEKDGDMYILPDKGNYQMIVRYGSSHGVELVGYTVDRIVSKFNRDNLEKFIDTYLSWVAKQCIESGKDKSSRPLVEDVKRVFETVVKINVYINNELTSESEGVVLVNDRLAQFMNTYKELSGSCDEGSIVEIKNSLYREFKGYDKLIDKNNRTVA